MEQQHGPITLCVLLWAHDGQQEALRAYEDTVLALIGEYGGEVLQRLARLHGEGPDEAQVIRFRSQLDLDRYMADERRTALAAQRDAAVRRTDVMEATALT